MQISHTKLPVAAQAPSPVRVSQKVQLDQGNVDTFQSTQAQSDGSGLMSRILLSSANGVAGGAAVTGAVMLGQYAMQAQGIVQGLAFAGAGLVALPAAASLLIGEGGTSPSQKIIAGLAGLACGAAAAAVGLPVALVAGTAAAGLYCTSLGLSGN